MLTGEIDSSEEKEYSSSVYDGFSQYASSSVASTERLICVKNDKNLVAALIAKGTEKFLIYPDN